MSVVGELSTVFSFHILQLCRRDRDWNSFQALTKLIPVLKQKISDPNELARSLYYTQVRRLSPQSLDSTNLLFSLQLLNGANSARSDDTSRIKPKVAEWINTRPGISSEQRLSLSNRNRRGIQHDITGRLLCPIKYDWDDPR